MVNQGAYQYALKSLPQDPYFPEEDKYGPSFLDDGACLCSLRLPETATGESADNINSTGDSDNTNNTDETTKSESTNDADDTDNTSTNGKKTKRDDQAAWQCIGNQTQGVYKVTTGKWFKSLHGGSVVALPIYDASNGPDTSKALTWDSGAKALVDADTNALSPYDQACTGLNRTFFSTSFYEAFAQNAAGESPIAAAPCWRPEAVPIEIQNLTSWQSDGCSEGFLCANSTTNSLPQYCPPVAECQERRLAGKVCSFQGNNIGMGPFEPVVCQKGWYCPTESGGRDTFLCPAGTYCQPGASTPTPCAVGSYCPKKSTSQRYLVPLAVLLVVDCILAFVLLWYTVNKRFRNTCKSHAEGKSKGMRALTVKMTGYKELSDEAENEMLPMQPTMPRSETWTGFQAALDVPTPGSRTGDFDSGLSPELRVFVESMRKATDATQFGLSFTYTDLSFHPKGAVKPILQNVTGSIERGSLTAVMGGSGAGKSTFVNVLMGKTTNTGGSVTINNIPGKIKRYKKLIGYVPQDDIVLPELTVYENILHSARIRLPRTWKDKDIQAHVNSVVDCLELSHVRDSMVGSVGKPVISGGQRKRVSIGMELAAAPMAIFLDEPTSGLDATAASSIMLTLKAIARLGISVIVIIHQPRMEIFEMLDDLILLGNGQIIYEGTERGVQQYFEDFGYLFPEHSNAGDVVTDIITGNGRAYKSSGSISKDALISRWASSRESANLKRRSEIRPDRNSIIETTTQQRALLRTRGAPRMRQLGLCLQRALLQQWRTKSTLFFELGLASLAGVLLGLAENGKQGVLFTGIYNEPYEVLSIATDFKSVPEMALLTAIAIGLVSGAPGVKVFSEEMLLYRREAEAGHSRFSYFIAKNLSVLPRMILGCFHFTTVILLLAVPIINWGIAFFANLIYFYCIYGLASCISMVVRREDAPLLATMISLIVGILSGAAPPLSKVKDWHMEWLWRASPGTWLAEVYFGQMTEPFRYLYQVDMAAEATGYHLHWLWRNMLILFAIGTIYRVLAFVGLLGGKRLRV
ncbi:Uu.00g121720.m01.CDS01 [Anthostomella pinea]|uniref:Uu.00g121720.m01.CDS01 n=1 Tax=Anthostomella pinea TaxID=933095 RepID=A0AAI8VGZ7_9PEZI|nr:Uu.00g121720.m01.CDS01 [Anthostomella pinea]